jgi:hypothetical protein
MSSPTTLDGFTRVYSGPKHEVYCNGPERVWVYREAPDRSLPVRVDHCPQCRCSAFAQPKGGPR